ncbi:hypothetical protein ACFLRO_00455 [Bacteroidota bacterium]
MNTIDIDFDAVCEMGMNLDLMVMNHYVATQAYAFRWTELEAAGEQSRLNLDSLLTKGIANAFSGNPPSTQVLIFYELRQDYMRLSVCDKSKESSDDYWEYEALSRIPGFIESGRDYLLPNSKPMFYWNGERLFRTLGRENDSSRFLVADYGSTYGLNVGSADPEIYELIRSDPVGRFDYAAFPDSDVQAVETPRGPVKITNVWFRVQRCSGIPLLAHYSLP